MNTRIFSLFLVLAIFATVALANKRPTVEQRYKVTLANQNCKKNEKPLELVCRRANKNDRSITFSENVYESKVVNNKQVVSNILIQREDVRPTATPPTASRNH